MTYTYFFHDGSKVVHKRMSTNRPLYPRRKLIGRTISVAEALSYADSLGFKVLRDIAFGGDKAIVLEREDA